MSVTMREMLEAGVHFGHQTRFWNPKMAPYIFGASQQDSHRQPRKDPGQVQRSHGVRASKLAANRGTILFVGTKRQAREIMAEEAAACWRALRRPALAGRHADQLQDGQDLHQASEGHGSWQVEAGDLERMSKKEALTFRRELEKLQKSIGGIKDMAACRTPSSSIDVGYHKIAITEAKKLGIPVIGVVDTNHSPEGVDYVIPGNDDSSRAIQLCTPVAWPMPSSKAAARWLHDIVAAGGDDEFVEVEEAAE